VNINIDISKEGDQYIAVIKDGWWVAQGKTKKQAIDRVLKAYLKFLEFDEKMVDKNKGEGL